MEAFQNYSRALAGLQKIEGDYKGAVRTAEAKRDEANKAAARLVPEAESAVKAAQAEVENQLSNGRRALALVDEEGLLPKKIRAASTNTSLTESRRKLVSVLGALEQDVEALSKAQKAALERERASREAEKRRREEEARRKADADAAAARAAVARQTMIAIAVIALIVIVAAFAVL